MDQYLAIAEDADELPFPVLAFDTALNGCAVCVGAGSRRISGVFETGREQAAMLLPLIQSAMTRAGVSFPDLGLIVTTVGPGSFTGLRIGLSTARGLSLALSCPVEGVENLSAMAANCAGAGDGNAAYMLVLGETKRSDFYYQWFDLEGKNLSDAVSGELNVILADERLGRSVLAGDGAERFVREAAEGGLVLSNEVRSRAALRPEILLALGLKNRAARGAGPPSMRAEPVYLRAADVSVSNKIQRQIDENSRIL